MLKKFTVRSVIEWGNEYPVDEKHLYEERITLWSAKSLDEAIALAESDDKEYCKDNGFKPLGLYQAYQIGEIEGDREVFSLLRSSDLSPDEYLDSFFDTGKERQRRSEQ